MSTGKNAEQGGAEARVAFVWTADGLGALVANAYAATRFFAFSGKPVTVPALTLATQTAAEREQYPCRHVMVAPEAAVQLTAGDVMVFSGALCGVGGSGDPQGLGVERLRAGRKQGDVALLPLPSELPAGVTWTVDAAAAASPIDVMVVAHGFDNPVGDQKPQRFSYAARWDGQTWRLDDAAPQQLRRLWAIGGRFAALDEQGRLWLQRAGAWLEVEWQGDSASAEKPGELTQLSRVGQETWLVQENELPEGAFSSRVYRVKVE